jgi:uncharacterized membrane protein
MNWIDRLSLFGPLEFGAVIFTGVLWLAIGLLVENAPASRQSVSQIMAQYRRDWMVQMAARDNRIFDAQMVGALRQGTAFFASTSVIAIGGALALIGNADQLAGVAEDLTLIDDPTLKWEIKLLFLCTFLISAFLKFVWSNRLFGYCSVLMGAVPNDPEDPQAASIAAKAGEINIAAARSFNRGLRSLYFALASVAFLAGPEALILAGLFTTAVIWRREFASYSRQILLAR